VRLWGGRLVRFSEGAAPPPGPTAGIHPVSYPMGRYLEHFLQEK